MVHNNIGLVAFLVALLLPITAYATELGVASSALRDGGKAHAIRPSEAQGTPVFPHCVSRQLAYPGMNGWGLTWEDCNKGCAGYNN